MTNNLMTAEENKALRLYFTADKICIGSYNEVEKYEQETQQSYWASDFFQLPLSHNFVGQTLDQINLAQTEWRYRNIKSLGIRSFVSKSK